ncbi:MAG: hypothetical protein JJU41_03920 [Bacteroidetes bacterium]|nr:hypothetical protein [Bacteroidota bacterium]MCH8525308.1 hypothetical protein [Balneolales bacterium]
MKITHAKFLKLLSAELGQDEKITGIHLNGLISEIINSTEDGKPYKIEGFGTFLRKDGELQFSADDRLAAEINYNYEGMPDIDVNEAKSVVDDELDETTQKPLKKAGTIIVDEGVANEPDVTEEGSAETISERHSDTSRDSTREEVNETEGALQEELSPEEDPFGIKEDEVSPKTSFSFDESADENEIIKDDGAPEAEVEGHDADEDVFAEVLESDDTDSGVKNEADAKLDSFIASRVSKTDQAENVDDTEAKPEAEEGLTNKSQTESEEEYIDLDEALTYSAESDVSANSPSEDGPADEEIKADEPEHELSGTDDSESELDFTKMDQRENADETTQKQNLADAASQKTVKKPEPVIKVGSIVGKKTPAVPPVKSKDKPADEFKAAGVAAEAVEGSDAQEAAKERPLPGDRRKGESNFAVVIITVAAVVLIAAGVWWYLGSQPEPLPTAGILPEAGLSQAMLDEVTENEDVPAVISEPAETAEPTQAELDLAAATNWEEPRPVGSRAEASSSETVAESQSASRFGLRGEAQPMEGRVFSIVVHSLPNRVDGNIQCDEIARLDLRCVVVEARVNNRITYRVGIGQFETFAEAQRQAAQLPEPYRSRNFPARIN